MSAQEQYVPPTGGTYLLTEDLPDKIEQLRHVGIRTPGYHNPIYGLLQDRLADALQNSLAEGQVVYRVKMHKLATQIASFIDSGDHEWAGEDVLVVSTCPELAYPERGVSIQVNRLVDFNGKYFSLVEDGKVQKLPVGPRPGHPPLPRQIASVVASAHGRRLVIAEDGIFSGDTLLTIITTLQDAGAEIAGVVTGFRFQLGSNTAIDAAGVPIHVVHPGVENLIDWVPDHDFLPFTPGCGKVLGSVVGREVFPFTDYTGATFSVPYIEPFGYVAEWASIPEYGVEKFSRECLAIARDLYVELDRLNPDMAPLTVRDVMSSPYQRVSIPVSVTGSHKSLCSESIGIVEVLDGYLA